MKKKCLSLLFIFIIAMSCVACQTGKNNDGEVSNGENTIIENTDNNENETPSDTSNDDESDSSNGNKEDGIVIGEGDFPEEGEVVYQEPYAVVQISSPWQHWYVEKGEVKEIVFSEYSAEIIPGEKYTKFTITSSYINGKLCMIRRQGGYYTNKIPKSDDKILLKSFYIGLEFNCVSFRVFDINTKEILNIYPDNVEKDYYVKEVWVSADLSEVVFMTNTEVYYYDGTQVTEIESFDGKIEALHQPKIMMEDGKILVVGYQEDFSKKCCYIYDFATNELIERIYSATEENYVSTTEWCSEAGGYWWLGFRYGYGYRDGYFTIVDVLTEREDKTEIAQDKVRYIENVSEDWFFVLADYGYFIEKSTGRIIAKTEYEIAPSKEDDVFTIALVPSDEDIYFCMKLNDSEEKAIYKIEMNE